MDHTYPTYYYIENKTPKGNLLLKKYYQNTIKITYQSPNYILIIDLNHQNIINYLSLTLNSNKIYHIIYENSQLTIYSIIQNNYQKIYTQNITLKYTTDLKRILNQFISSIIYKRTISSTAKEILEIICDAEEYLLILKNNPNLKLQKTKSSQNYNNSLN